VLQERPDGKKWQQPEFLSLQQLFNYSGRICSECGIPISHKSVPDSTSTSVPRKERARELQRKLFMEQEATAFGHEQTQQLQWFDQCDSLERKSC